MTTTADDVWQLLAELAIAQKETERIIKETSQETDRRFQETDRRFQEMTQETNRQIKQVNKQIGQLGNRLGEFVESQLRPSAVKLFCQRGIDVHELHSDISVQREDGGLEIDLLVVNDTEVVLVEVKSKLTEKDIDQHLQRLDKFKRFMPRYSDMKTYGAMGAMVVSNEVANYADQKGLFVITQNGDNMVIINNEKFKPKVW